MELFRLFGSVFVDNEKANQSIQKTDGLAGKLGEGFLKVGQVIGGAMLSVGAAVAGVAIKGVASAEELKKAVNQLGAETGATEEEMTGFEQSMKNIYANNFGESFEDIAQSMADIHTQTNLTGEELEKATENALMLRDTFEFEVSESTRAANQLMKEFGLTSDEAYTLIAQGAQEGLNANDDLLDTINEYSLHFNQLGFSAEEMFNMLGNGAETGTFSIDKLGDAMKEFGIRVKDESDGTMDAFTQLGLNAESLTSQFASGGDQAQDAFNQVVQALMSTDDQVLQNQIGVALFGTMWEDLGVNAIAALTDVNGEFDMTKDTLTQINEIKYDSFGEAMAGIGRQMEVGILIPLGEKILPILNIFSTWIEEHMPQIQAGIEVAFGVIAKVMDAVVIAIEGTITWFENLLKNNTELSGELETVWKMIQSMFSTVFKEVSELISSFIEWCIKFWDKYGEDLLNTAQSMWELIKGVFQSTFDILVELINFFTSLFEGDWEGMKEAAINIVTSMWDGIKELFTNSLDFLANLGSTLFDLGADLLGFLWDGIKSVWNDLCDWVEEKVSWIADKLMFWRDAEDEMGSSKSEKRDGSHRNGLSYVPFDGYLAETHLGEGILTKEENTEYRQMKNAKASSSSGSTVDIGEIIALLKELIRKIDKMPREMRNEKLFAL